MALLAGDGCVIKVWWSWDMGMVKGVVLRGWLCGVVGSGCLYKGSAGVCI